MMSDKAVEVHVESDHIQRLASVGGKPINGLMELIWNALDADAKTIGVAVTLNDLKGFEAITIRDDGDGIDPAKVHEFFGGLGGSWKQKEKKTKGGRTLHGSLGKGRFKAFGLGGRVEWSTRFATNEGLASFSLVGTDVDLRRFSMTDVKQMAGGPTGTQVTISNIPKNWQSLLGDEARHEVAEAIAVYLEAYPDVEVWYQEKRVDPTEAQVCRENYQVGPVKTEPGEQSAELTIIEWNKPTSRRLYLCDAKGCTLNELAPGIQAPGQKFTAYLRTDYIRTLEQENLLAVAEMHPGLSQLIDQAKTSLKEHFNKREAQLAADTLKRWKDENAYPYQGEASGPVESVERQVFDVVALQIDRRLPDFSERDVRGRRLTFRLVRQALEESPEALATILTEVLELPAKEREEFAALLKRTSLSAIINASKVVTDRLTFLKGLDRLLFEPDVAKVLKERTQLHRILAQETWVFGEEYHLMVDDLGLTEVMRQVLEQEGITVNVLEPVKTHTGGAGIVDLMFARAKKHWGANSREYLVVELKRPGVKIDSNALQQCWKYAHALANHPKFKATDTRWDFWALSVELDAYAQGQTTQKDRPEGLWWESEDGRCRIWAVEWGTLLREAESRHEFFRQQLDLDVQAEDATMHLQATYEKYLPNEVVLKNTGS